MRRLEAFLKVAARYCTLSAKCSNAESTNIWSVSGAYAWYLLLLTQVERVINNAGMFALASLETVTSDQATSLFQTNVLGPTWLSKAALEALTETKGAIVNVSSTYGHKPTAQSAYYAASKAALEHLTRCWALELASRGIRVNAVAPGPTETPLLQQMGLSASTIEMIKQMESKSIPLGHRGKPDEVASWIVQLAGPAATWITGQIITVDGGLELI